MKEKILLLLLVSILLFSGCTQKGSLQANENPAQGTPDSAKETEPGFEKLNDSQPNNSELTVDRNGTQISKISCESDFNCFKEAIVACKEATASYYALGEFTFEVLPDCKVSTQSTECSIDSATLPYVSGFLELNAYCSNPIKFVECNSPDSTQNYKGLAGLERAGDLSIMIIKFQEISPELKSQLEEFLKSESKAGWKNEYYSIAIKNKSLKTKSLGVLFGTNFKALSINDAVDFDLKYFTENSTGSLNITIPPDETAVFYAKAVLPEGRTITEIRYTEDFSLIPKIVYTFGK